MADEFRKKLAILGTIVLVAAVLIAAVTVAYWLATQAR